jgi:nicotinate phosphoribosyltransferase
VQNTPNPGNKKAWRVYDKRGNATLDLLTLEEENPAELSQFVARHPSDHTMFRTLKQSDIQSIEPLHETILDKGKLVYDLPTIEEIRQRRIADQERLDPGIRRLINPHVYHVSLSDKLWNLKQELINSALEKSK